MLPFCHENETLSWNEGMCIKNPSSLKTQLYRFEKKRFKSKFPRDLGSELFCILYAMEEMTFEYKEVRCYRELL